MARVSGAAPGRGPISTDTIAGLVCLAGAILLLLASRGLPRSPLVPIGPDFYPRLLFGAAILLSAILVVQGLVRREAPARRPAQYRLVVGTFAVFGAYVGLLPLLGFRVATLLFVLGLQVLLEPPRTGRGWMRVVVVAVATTVLTYLVFEQYLTVLLPRGRLTGF
ncbi:MAG: tripartite tricarboxylate transporter TctB family protein [Candidatus Rokubacteria bacterium]|nr:tripartite tricarboxylate transporter TctB family protein [Candidatus Rokubacteria bacterium]